MPRTPLLLIAAALALGTLALGCMPAVVPPAPPPASPEPSTARADTSLAVRMTPPASEWHTADDSIYFLAAQWTFAVSTRDTLTAARLLDDGFISQAADGTMRTKPAVLRDLARSAYPLDEMQTGDVRVQHIGDMAIVLSRIQWASTDAYPQTRAQYRVTDVFVRRPAGWRLASEQMALIQPVQITVEDSMDVAREVKNLFDIVRQYGRVHSRTETTDAPTAFSAEAPDRLDDAAVPDRVLSMIDLPRPVYFDTLSPPVAEPFAPEGLRIQMLSPEAAVVTFEIQHANITYRRTLVFRHQHGRWLIAHVHASNVRRPISVMDIGAVCDTVPPRDANPSRPHPVAKIPAPRQPRPDAVVIVGAVTERSTGRPLQSALVIFDRVVTPPSARIPGEQVPTDANGGFSTVQLPGTYAVRVRRIGYAPHPADTVTLRAATVDTLRFSLRYQSCTGY